MEQWQLVGLITRRSAVRIRPPQLLKVEVISCTDDQASLRGAKPSFCRRIAPVKPLNWIGDNSFPVWVKPRARRNQVVGIREGALHVALTAPPVEGKANEALVKFLASVLEIRQNQVEIISGERSRCKIVRINGVVPAELHRRVEAVLA